MTPPLGLTRRQFTQLGLASVAALLVSCGSDGGQNDVATVDVKRLAANPKLATDVVAATNRFAADLYGIAARDVDNLAFSPLSIGIALAMTSEGARGTSREQIDDVFHLTDVDDRHGGWNAVDQALARRNQHVEDDHGESREVVLTVVNRLWAQTDLEIRRRFLTVLAANYGVGVGLVDFKTDGEGAREAINGWVADNTNDRIPNLIPRGVLNAMTRLVLTNAVYFKAPWAAELSDTGDRPFHTLDGSTVKVPMMSDDGGFGTKAGDGWQAVTLSYAGEDVEMLVVVPDEGRFADIERRVTDGLLADIPVGIERQKHFLMLPKFEIRTPLPLTPALSALGIPDPFATERADFSGITTQVDLFIRAVLHEAFVAVDEHGTEAAAATAIVDETTSASSAPPIVVDRPFLWAIRDVPTGAILFLGRVVDPSIKAR